MLKKIFAAAALAAASGAVFAEEAPALPFGLSFSGSAALTTDYRFRGVTQTQNDPALQGGFTLGHASGLYFGLWGSNVNFGSGTPSLELDPSIGYAVKLESFSSKPVLDVGVLYYNYPSASDLNWAELYGKLTFAGLMAAGDSLLTNLNYTNDYAGVSADSWNVNASYSIPFGASGFGAVAAVGYTAVDGDKYKFNGDDNYVDWKAGLTYGFKSVPGATAELAAIGSNIDVTGKETDNFSPERAVETGAVFTLSKTF